jgi:tripartite-type tricarboxylate transporter receptor subunit TctC
VKELIDLARTRPGTLNYASSGSGSTAHLASELFKSMAGVTMVHVPYKGAGPALLDLVGGQVQMMVTGISSTLPYIKAGKLKALGVSSEKRLPLLPEVPAIAESVPGYEVITWYGVFAPAATPGAIVERLQAALVQTLETPDARTRLSALGADVHTTSPREFARMIRAERAKWARIVREAGVQLE